MRHKSRLPGFLFSFPHAVAFKGGGAPAMPAVPTYTPPPSPYVPPTQNTDPVNYDVARKYWEGAYTGDATPYSDPWNDSFNEWTSGLESAWGVDSYTKLNYGQLTGQIKPGATGDGTGGTGTDQPPAPPAPDAPVTSPNGQTVTQPTPYTPPPPVSDRSSEVMQAGREARRNSKKRKGLLSTYLAGETGGAQGAAPTLLGRSGP